MAEGIIATFYSYKGGVGRTFAMANIAALLSMWGFKTLCIDWDLEAPGLHLYFRPWMTGEIQRGLTELVQDYSDGKKPYWKDYTTSIYFSGAKQPLLLMSAGRQDKSYVERMQSLDWAKLYAERNLGVFLEEVRKDWKESLDFVLIDSRTGITDIGGICTVQLPDMLVPMFTANDQSLRGSVDIIERARLMRSNLPLDREKLLTLPIVARFDGRREYELAQQWLKTFAEVLAPFYAEWAHRDITISDLLNFTRIPYIAYWSFGEKLPVIEKGTSDPDDIGFALETLAAIVAKRLSFSEILVSNRDFFVDTARKGPAIYEPAPAAKQSSSPVRIFISYAPEDESLRRELEAHLSSLKRQGEVEILSDSSTPGGSAWISGINPRLEQADIILLLISSDYLASDFNYSVEMRYAFERHEKGKTRIVPVILRTTYWEVPPFDKLQVLPANGIPVTQWPDRDAAFADIAQGLRKIIQELRSRM